MKNYWKTALWVIAISSLSYFLITGLLAGLFESGLIHACLTVATALGPIFLIIAGSFHWPKRHYDEPLTYPLAFDAAALVFSLKALCLYLSQLGTLGEIDNLTGCLAAAVVLLTSLIFAIVLLRLITKQEKAADGFTGFGVMIVFIPLFIIQVSAIWWIPNLFLFLNTL